MEMTEIKFSAEAASDYLSRHDNQDCGAHEIVAKQKLTWTLRLTEEQLENLIDDLQYQVDEMGYADWEGARAYARKCERALDSIIKQTTAKAGN